MLQRQGPAFAQHAFGFRQRPRRDQRAAEVLETPAGQLRIGGVLAGTHHFAGERARTGEVASTDVHPGQHQGRCAPAMQVAGLAVGGDGFAHARLALVPMAVVEIEKAHREPGKGDRRCIGRALRHGDCAVVIAARHAASAERHQAEADAAQAARFGQRVLAALADVQLEQAVQQHAFLVEEVVGPRHHVHDGRRLRRHRHVHVTSRDEAQAPALRAQQVRAEVADDGAPHAAARRRIVQTEPSARRICSCAAS